MKKITVKTGSSDFFLSIPRVRRQLTDSGRFLLLFQHINYASIELDKAVREEVHWEFRYHVRCISSSIDSCFGSYRRRCPRCAWWR